MKKNISTTSAPLSSHHLCLSSSRLCLFPCPLVQLVVALSCCVSLFVRATPVSRRVVCACEAYLRAACLLATMFAQRRGYRRRCSSSDRCWRAPRHRGATRGCRNQLFHRVDARCVAPSVFLTTLSLDDRRTRGTSRARSSPRGCLLLIVVFFASPHWQPRWPCRDCRVTVTPFLGVLAQHSLLVRRSSLRRFIDVVIVVVAALGAFRRVSCSSLPCHCRCRRNDDTTGSRRVV